MPLPRFTRLPVHEQRRILDAARAVFATQGVSGTTYADVIAETGISRSSMYNYFDGREDLLGVVLDDVASRLRAALGTWSPQSGVTEFWATLEAATTKVALHIAEHPDDLALIDPAFLLRAQAGFQDWIADVIDNGIGIGVIAVECDRDLLVTATGALMRGLDAWWAEQSRSGRAVSLEDPWLLLRNLWGTTAASTPSGRNAPS